MADIFLSYAREDRDCAELLAGALSRHGWAVWWDRDIDFGRSFSEVIESEIDQARCIIVLWSRSSVTSGWVQNEAAEAARRKLLVPVCIEDVRPPMGFRHLQTAELFDWRKGFEGPAFQRFLQSIDHFAPRAASPKAAAEPADRVVSPASPAPAATPPPQTGFWISQSGQMECAPDLSTLRKWAEEGRLKADALVYDAMLQRWIRALEVPDLRSVYPKAAPARPEKKAAPQPAPVAPKVETPPAQPEPGTPRTDESSQAPTSGFWIHQKGQQHWARDGESLRRWAEGQRIERSDRIYVITSQQWIRADQVPELRDFFRESTAEQPAKPPRKARPLLIFAGSLAGIIGLVFIIAVIVEMANHKDEPPTNTEAATTTTAPTETTATAAADTAATGTTATTDSAAMTGTPQLVALTIENQCTDDSIDVAIGYRNSAADKWISSGWYNVPAKGKNSDLPKVIGPRVYFYGFNTKHKWACDKTDPICQAGPVNLKSKFDVPFEETQGEGLTSVQFFGRKIDPQSTTLNQILHCTN